MAQFVEMEIDQGADFLIDLGLKNDDGTYMNFSGYTYSSEMRKTFSSSSSVATFVVTGSGNKLLMSLDATTTSSIPAGRYVFDIKQTNTATKKITRFLEGIVTVNPQVTR